MEKQVFRQKNMDQISSTDELHDYMHVTSPKLWMILSVILVLIIGFIVYASTITMENSIQVPAVVKYESGDGANEEMDIILTIPDHYKDVIKVNMDVRIADETGYIGAMLMLGDGDTEAAVFLDDEYRKLPRGNYNATVVIETISPISFLLN